MVAFGRRNGRPYFSLGGAKDVFDFEVEIEGFTEADRFIETAFKRTRDLRPWFQLVDKHLTLVLKRQFASEGAFAGMPWAALKPSTIRARQRPGHGRGGILRDLNRLWSALTKGRGPEAIRSIEKDRYERGTSVPYGVHHQLGTRKMPARPPIPDPMPGSVLRVWEKLLLGHVEGTI